MQDRMKELTRPQKLVMLALALRGGEAKEKDIIEDAKELSLKNETQINYLWGIARERLKDFKPSDHNPKGGE